MTLKIKDKKESKENNEELKKEEKVEMGEEQTQEASKEAATAATPAAAAAGEKGAKDKNAKFSKMQCEWTENGGEQTVMITNITEGKLAMKIKCSDNKLFRVRPVYTNIEAGKSTELGIFRNPGQVKFDRILVLFLQNKNDDPPEKVFENKALKPSITIIRQTGKEILKEVGAANK
ncbi:MSP domain protein [Oesophagostomum dentatum]|uniref:Major sperm protein n=1 Tax=Oesophagostomum dentatum TaxID=61180 RepID=A0A0B1SVF8_OESDE|nr:MSP domain protein [Oesophagostomum dentatum]